MPHYKCVMFWNCRQKGWSETYYIDSTAASLPDRVDSVASAFRDLFATKRVKLSGKQCEFYALRVSRVETPRGSQLFYGNLPQPDGFNSQNGGYDTDNPPSTLVCTMSDQNQFLKRQLHIRGIPDTIDQQGGRLVTGDTPGWDASFQAFADWLTNETHGYCWPSKAGGTVFDVVNYAAIPSTGQVHFEFSGTPFAGFQSKQSVTVRLSGINFKNSELNGQITLSVVDPNEADTVRPYAVFPYIAGGKMRFGATTWINIRNVTKTKIGSRDTGSPLLQRVGRGKARIHG